MENEGSLDLFYKKAVLIDLFSITRQLFCYSFRKSIVALHNAFIPY